MAINSKRKGADGEREVAALLREYGFMAERGCQYHGGPDSPDVKGVPHIHIEVKRVERLNINEAMQQAERDCGRAMPTVWHRKNRTPWLVTLHLDDFMTLYKGAKDSGIFE